ncbi:hypothetical protein [Flavobacterium sp. 14A]|uniref:hypothetical protein n=1 Tax=Flavobacterium sp. 14A TaxID=2735896 RepID=UPI0015710680|nr:hypothetical protein [Flavobacterium sp. 14A]NRT11506.1 hypothetical protein [Flavobacterium sp. 14A]
MNKYLYKKIEQGHSAYFENIFFISNEMCKERKSEGLEYFEELEPRQICEILGWRNEEDVHLLINSEIEEGNGLVDFLFRNDCLGFLAKCSIAEADCFRFKEDGTLSSYRISGGITTEFWVYAESIGELTEKLVKKSDAMFNEMMEEERILQKNL